MLRTRLAVILLASAAVACKGGGEEKKEEPANPTAKKASTRPAGSTGSIKGKVTFEGTPPEMPELPRFNDDGKPKDPACTTHEKADHLKVKDGGVKDVVVRIAVGGVKPPDSATKPAPQVIDQKNCMYSPHVVALMAGQQLDFKNSDDTLHNIHTYKDSESDFNIAQPKGSPDKLSDVGVPPGDAPYKVKCDVHPWMAAFALVTDHPYAVVTGDDGSFKLDNVPPGTYKLEAWHPYMGKKVVDVTVEGGKTADAKFAFAQGDYKAP
jgi:plastocyanin